MATLHNPTDNKLFCHRLQRILAPGETVDVSDEEAHDLLEVGGSVFVIDADAKASEPEDAPKRSAKRGTKAAGVSTTADVETRG